VRRPRCAADGDGGCKQQHHHQVEPRCTGVKGEIGEHLGKVPKKAFWNLSYLILSVLKKLSYLIGSAEAVQKPEGDGAQGANMSSGTDSTHCISAGPS
jgi:hypothetical protein